MPKFHAALLCPLLIITNLAHADLDKRFREAQVREIIFVGNSRFTSDQLKAELITKENKPANLKDAKNPFDRDVQKLNYLYFKEGYVQAKIDQPEMTAAGDDGTLRLVFNVKEGERFKMGKVEFEGKCPLSRTKLLAGTKLHKQQFFNYQIMQDDLKVLEPKCGKALNLIPRTRIREADREVDVSFQFSKKT